MSDSIFDDLPEDVQQGIRTLGWSQPMPVQEKVIPAMRSGRDLIVKAQTGSGKTGAFGVPIVAGIDAEVKGCQALVLAPTRELANQFIRAIAGLAETKHPAFRRNGARHIK